MSNDKQKVMFMNFELDITPEELIKKIGESDKGRHDKIDILTKVLEKSTDGYWDWSIGSASEAGGEDYEYLSPKFKEQLGYTVEEMANVPSSWMNILRRKCNSPSS